MQVLMAECSDSTLTNSASSSPLATMDGEVLHDVGLGGDGIGGDGLGPGHLHRMGHRDGNFHAYSMGHYSSSGTMLMQPVTHSLAQMPQPLQYVFMSK